MPRIANLLNAFSKASREESSTSSRSVGVTSAKQLSKLNALDECRACCALQVF